MNWPSNIVYVISIISTIWIELNSFRVNTLKMPVNTAHVSERFGILIMIMLGECILALVLTDVDASLSSLNTFRITAGAFVVCYVCYDMYFRSHVQNLNRHALANA